VNHVESAGAPSGARIRVAEDDCLISIELDTILSMPELRWSGCQSRTIVAALADALH